MGWSNQIPNPFVIGGGGVSGVIDVVDNNNKIIIELNNVGMEVFSTLGVLIASVANTTGPDSFGNTVRQGIASYDSTTSKIVLQLNAAQLSFNLLDQLVGNNGSIFCQNPHAVASQSPSLTMTAPSTNAVPDQAFFSCSGLSNDGTSPPLIHMGKLLAGDCTVLIDGVSHYSVAGVQETWHAASFAANWGNNGGAFRNVKYQRTADGQQVALTGLAAFTGTTTSPSPVFTLPVGYRPNGQINLTASNSPSPTVNPTTCTIQVLTSGVVQITNFSGTVNPGPVSFENQSFYLTT